MLPDHIKLKNFIIWDGKFENLHVDELVTGEVLYVSEEVAKAVSAHEGFWVGIVISNRKSFYYLPITSRLSKLLEVRLSTKRDCDDITINAPKTADVPYLLDGDPMFSTVEAEKKATVKADPKEYNSLSDYGIF